MKIWTNPEVIELEISATATGKNLQPTWDEIRVDQDGEYWAGMASGGDSKPDVVGPIIKPKN